jgi:predicted transcriptional regulator
VYSINLSSIASFFVRSFKYRDRITIMSDILKSVSNSPMGKKKTQIMQSANLNYTQANKYIKLLIINGFIVFTDMETYKITSKGLHFLQTAEQHKIRTRII